MSQREIALELMIHHDTVARMLVAISKEDKEQNKKFRSKLSPKVVVFD